jgi:hypothetical protein
VWGRRWGDHLKPVPVEKRTLCKSLCKLCTESNPNKNCKGWTPAKEQLWEQHGTVYCPGMGRQIRICRKTLPVGCRYAAEQIMLGGQDGVLDGVGHSGVQAEQPE